mgnify:CR=1 FL=1
MNTIQPFQKRVLLASPTMHGEELEYMKQAYDTNWMTTVGENINELEKSICQYTGSPYAVALSSGTAALHLAAKLAGEKLYGQPKPGHGTLEGKKVFCTDMTFDATVNPVAYEGGEAVFVDTETNTWNMDPNALKKAFELYPEVRLIVIAHLYGTPGKMDELCEIAKRHGALIVEDAAESLGAIYHSSKEGKLQTGTIGDYGVLSFNGNKIITGSSGGMLLTKDEYSANKARKWSTQSREDAPWYQHEEIGYNYRMSNVIAGVVRGQMLHLKEHMDRKREIYENYKEGFKDFPVHMNPYDDRKSVPNFWLSCLLIDSDAVCCEVCGEKEALYIHEEGKTCPTEIRETLASYNVESRPIWKPMHLQPIYRNHAFITRNGNGRAQSNAYISERVTDVGEDIFRRGLCLPSDIKMTKEEQSQVIELLKGCFA